MTDEEEDYDAVVDVLTKHKEKLWEMTKRNLENEFIGFNIMDDIRLKQIGEMEECIAMWKDHKKSSASDG
jgi:hypothetical protein